MTYTPGPAYADLSDFAVFGLPSSTGSSSASYTTIVTQQLQASSRFADTYIASRVTLPLASWTASLTQKVCEHAAYGVLRIIGFNPEKPNDRAVFTSYEAAIKWFEMVKEIQLTPDFIPVSPAANVVSDLPRGWWPEADQAPPFEPID